MSGRAQSEAVGMLAVTVVVIVVSSTVGFAILESTASRESASTALGDYRFEADATGVSVTHVGGDALPLSEFTLLVRSPDGRTTRPFTAGTLADGGSVFAPGSTWRYADEPFPVERTVELDVLVVHRPSETVVDGTTLLVRTSTDTPTATPTPTPTATPTASPPATPTPTPTATPTATPAATPTATPAATPTATPTPTPDEGDDDDWWGDWWNSDDESGDADGGSGDADDGSDGADGESNDESDDGSGWWPW